MEAEDESLRKYNMDAAGTADAVHVWQIRHTYFLSSGKCYLEEELHLTV